MTSERKGDGALPGGFWSVTSPTGLLLGPQRWRRGLCDKHRVWGPEERGLAPSVGLTGAPLRGRAPAASGSCALGGPGCRAGHPDGVSQGPGGGAPSLCSRGSRAIHGLCSCVFRPPAAGPLFPAGGQHGLPIPPLGHSRSSPRRCSSQQGVAQRGRRDRAGKRKEDGALAEIWPRQRPEGSKGSCVSRGPWGPTGGPRAFVVAWGAFGELPWCPEGRGACQAWVPTGTWCC